MDIVVTVESSGQAGVESLGNRDYKRGKIRQAKVCRRCSVSQIGRSVGNFRKNWAVVRLGEVVSDPCWGYSERLGEVEPCRNQDMFR